MRAIYGVSVVNTNSNLCSASVTRVLYAISCWIEPRYNGTLIKIPIMKIKSKAKESYNCVSMHLSVQPSIHMSIWVFWPLSGILLIHFTSNLFISCSPLDQWDPSPPSLAEGVGARGGCPALHVDIPFARGGHQSRGHHRATGRQPQFGMFPRHQLPLQVLGHLHHGRALHYVCHGRPVCGQWWWVGPVRTWLGETTPDFIMIDLM